jgi:hypothetical protein
LYITLCTDIYLFNIRCVCVSLCVLIFIVYSTLYLILIDCAVIVALIVTALHLNILCIILKYSLLDTY